MILKAFKSIYISRADINPCFKGYDRKMAQQIDKTNNVVTGYIKKSLKYDTF
jgi:hypothetical protein